LPSSPEPRRVALDDLPAALLEGGELHVSATAAERASRRGALLRPHVWDADDLARRFEVERPPGAPDELTVELVSRSEPDPADEGRVEVRLRVRGRA
jgi:hypothetical protein